ncbi:hypothetical protein NDU88_008439 [Pleurodeles waltl]|uniref:Uncharacterized protein n=1 Tax=Pleurodeles waltl TaxID=8319 RepID=A0AAV7QRR8_PLEWA|nr:hypothetical protein NDU88_008439 [Pleurodeles waltl]
MASGLPRRSGLEEAQLRGQRLRQTRTPDPSGSTRRTMLTESHSLWARKHHRTREAPKKRQAATTGAVNAHAWCGDCATERNKEELPEKKADFMDN